MSNQAPASGKSTTPATSHSALDTRHSGEAGPDWSRARHILEGIKTALRISLAGQVLIGQELYTLKEQLGFAGRGGDRRSNRNDFSLNRTWEDWCKGELGVTSRTADNWIECFHAAKSRVKKLGGQPRLLALLDTRPGDLDDEARNILAGMVDKLVWGDTQKDLLEEFRIAKVHNTSGLGGDTSAHRKPTRNQQAQQLAFTFFRRVPVNLGKAVRVLGNTRLNPDYQKLLATLPASTSDPEAVSLEDLESSLSAALEGDLPKVLEDVRRELKNRHTKTIDV